MLIKFEDGKGYYDGDVRNGFVRTGYGNESYSDGRRRNCFYLEGKRRGYGEESYNGDVIYRGDWFNDKKHGYGYHKYSNGRYFGGFVNGLRHGFGVFFYSDGTCYTGEWKCDKQHGKGTYIYLGGASRLEGWWRDGKLSGICFHIDADGKIERRNYADGEYNKSQATEETEDNRNCYDVSGIYGRLFRDGSFYYGKYLKYDEKTVLCGSTLVYVNDDNWKICFYENDLEQGEVAELKDGYYSRSLYIDGKLTGSYVEFKEDTASCGFCTENRAKDFSLEYEYLSNVTVGERSDGALFNNGLVYDFEDERLYAGDFYYGRLDNQFAVAESNDFFGSCVTNTAARYSDFAVRATPDNFYICKVENVDGKKSESVMKYYYLDRKTGEVWVKNPLEKMEYYSDGGGSRTYYVEGKMEITINADGSFIKSKICDGVRNVLIKQDDVYERREYLIDADPSDDPEYITREVIGGSYFSVDKEHKNDAIALGNIVYSGETRGLGPYGRGCMSFPGGSFVSGEWNGYESCQGATFTWETGYSEPVTVEGGVITFPSGEKYRFIKLPD